ncbi:MAG: M16 family metallopeptidase [Pyrinomonadaceae bacterium]
MGKLLLSFLFLSVTALAQTTVPPMNIKERVLDNGLRVVSVRDISSPVVTVQVWYRVGGKDDPSGKSGFAHMFEHMMFKATTNMPNEMMDRLTEDVGGWNNAFTREDVTAYHEEIPENYLQTLLWAEADRMVNLAVDAKNFASERDVVKEEYRQSVESNPYGKLFWFTDELSYSKHPYKFGVIGNLQQLEAAKLEDAFAFYHEYYRPDNAALIVVGDFEQNQLDDWVNKYFAAIKNPAKPIERVTVEEPAREKEVVFNETQNNVPFPAVAITYFAPPSTSPDVPALKVLAGILSRGESSRLYQELVYKKQLVAETGFFADIRVDKGLLTFFAIAAGGKDLPEIEANYDSIIKEITANGPTEKELAKVKNQMVMSALRSRETVTGKASAIGNAYIYDMNPKAANDEIAKLQAVTAADVKSVAEKYLQKNSRAVINYRNQETNGGSK